MQKLFVLLLSFMMLFTSSCTMKNMLWDFLGAESTMSAKALPSQDRVSSSAALLELCHAKTGSLFDEPAVVTAASVKAPLLLLFSLCFLSWALFGYWHKNRPFPTTFPYSFPNTVPIYLKLGRLIYYS